MLKLQDKFSYIKELLNDKYCYVKEECGGFYYNREVLRLFKNTDMSYHANSYYDMPIYSVLNLIEDHNTIQEVREWLHNEYLSCYADSWYYNFIDILERIKID